MNGWWWLDAGLWLLATLRVSRLVTSDLIPGKLWIQLPLNKRAYRRGPQDMPGWSRYLDGLECPFCVGFWVGLAGLALLLLAGGPGDAADWWRFLAAAFGGNYVVGHVAKRLD